MYIEINFNKNKNCNRSFGKDSLTLSKQIFTRCSKEENRIKISHRNSILQFSINSRLRSGKKEQFIFLPRNNYHSHKGETHQ